jgi:curli biogenesis system outer membrane secretion channel CsgG
MNRYVHVVALFVFSSGLLATAGCQHSLTADPAEDYVKPTIAVMKFENRAPFPLGWNLSDGTADILVDRLMATRRFHVIERTELDSVLREQRLQNSGATRSQNRAAAGRLKNVQYLVKGTVTDFGHVASGSGFLSLGNWDIFGGANRAVMGMTLYVVDVESGEIICSESLEESVRAGDLNVKAVYQGVAFGGRVFYRTPLGRATGAVIDRAVRRVSDTIANRPWEPKIAHVQPDNTVIINGGRNRGMTVGAEFEVIEAGAPVIDPDSGDVLGRQPGRPLGRVRVLTVAECYSVAETTTGSPTSFQTGMRCRKAYNSVAANVAKH